MNWIVNHLFELSYGIKKSEIVRFMSHPAYLCGDRLSVSGRTARWWCSILHSKSKDESIYSIDRSAAITKSVYFLEWISSASSQEKLPDSFYLVFRTRTIALFFRIFFRNELPDNVIITIQYICNTWYIASIYITLSLLVLELIQALPTYQAMVPQMDERALATNQANPVFLIVFGVTGFNDSRIPYGNESDC